MKMVSGVPCMAGRPIVMCSTACYNCALSRIATKECRWDVVSEYSKKGAMEVWRRRAKVEGDYNYGKNEL